MAASAEVERRRRTLASVSAFAFQGTNAHALLEVMRGARVIGGGAATAFLDRGKHWSMPSPHAWVDAAAVILSDVVCVAAVFDVILGGCNARKSTVTLWDHVVHGKPLCPAAAFLETAVAAADRSYTNRPTASDAADARGGTPGVRFVAVPSPLVLPARDDAAATTTMRVTVRDDRVRVESSARSRSRSFEVLKERRSPRERGRMGTSHDDDNDDDGASNHHQPASRSFWDARLRRRVSLHADGGVLCIAPRRRPSRADAADALVVLFSPSTPAPSSRPRAFASLTCAHASQAGSFGVDPAMLDAGIHLAEGSVSTGTRAARIPSAVGAFCIRDDDDSRHHSRRRFASCVAREGDATAREAINDHVVGGGATLGGLRLTRPRAVDPATPGLEPSRRFAVETVETVETVLYETRWRATPSCLAAAGPETVSKRIVSATRPRPRRAAVTAERTASTALAAFLASSRAPSSSALLRTIGAHRPTANVAPSSASDASDSAGVWGAARAYGLEVMGTVDAVDAAPPAAAKAKAAAKAWTARRRESDRIADALTRTTRGAGAAHVARLLPRVPASAGEASSSSAVTLLERVIGGALLRDGGGGRGGFSAVAAAFRRPPGPAVGGAAFAAGGLGALGVVVTRWFLREGGDVAVMTGRSGRQASTPLPGSKPGALATTRALFVAVRSDASASEEARAALDILHEIGGGYTNARGLTVFNISGVLQDAAVANQTSGKVRVVCAPKTVAARILFDRALQVRFIQKFFTHNNLARFQHSLDRISFQLIDELFLYGTALRSPSRPPSPSRASPRSWATPGSSDTPPRTRCWTPRRSRTRTRASRRSPCSLARGRRAAWRRIAISPSARDARDSGC